MVIDGLNGVQIRKGENERPIFFSAANWVEDQVESSVLSLKCITSMSILG
ncbi:MAG: hypothetical protein RIS79_689 [Verrucomicrobiota bacterium]